MGTGVGEMALLQAAGIGAATGAGTAAITGGDPMEGALIGGLTAGAGHGFAGMGAAGGASTATSGVAAGPGSSQLLQAAGTTVPEVGAQSFAPGTDLLGAANSPPYLSNQILAGPQSVAGVSPGVADSYSYIGGQSGAPLGDGLSSVTGATPTPDVIDSLYRPYDAYSVGSTGMPSAAQAPMPSAVTPPVPTPPTPPTPQTALQQFYAKNPVAMPAGLGALGATIGAGPESNMPGEEEYSGPLNRFRYDPDKYRRGVRSGGLMDTEPARRMAAGGLGSYSDGGQMLKGPGDGMSDDIPASIGDEQPARLADGEFVVPADVVSGIGNGSTDAGAEALYAMLDRVRKARTGRTEQAPEIDAQRMMPA
jgi:hypothetical protein